MRVISPARLLTFIAVAVMLSILLAVPQQTARAFSITITTTDDDVTVNGNCTLREAIIAANTNVAVDACPAGDPSGTDTITLESSQFYDLTLTSTNEDASADGDLDIVDNAGVAPDLIINTDGFDYAEVSQASGADRVFHIISGTVVLDNLIISDGSAPAGFGGGINNAGTLTLTNSYVVDNSAGSGFGGGISSSGTLTVTDSTFENNTASGGFGGAINASGTVTITGSTFVDNSADGAFGGDINNAATMNIANSTFDGGTASFGGSIFNAGAANLTNVTITGGTASFGGGINNAGGTLTVTNSIIAEQASGTDCAGTITSGGNNIENGTSCGFIGAGDQQNVTTGQLNLGPLQNNGGLTDTRALGTGSLAINAGNQTVCTSSPVNSVDQRGLSRTTATPCDVGAFEVQPADLIAIKENSTPFDIAYVDYPFEWYIELLNDGDEELSIPAGTVLFVDHIPVNVTDVSANVFNLFAADGGVTCTVTPDVDWNEVVCTVDAGGLILYAQGWVEVTITLTPTETGTLDNPVQLDGAFCWVDPDGVIDELEEENNFCDTNSVTVDLAPDLAVVKTNNTNGVTTPGGSFIWTIMITNEGAGTAQFDGSPCNCGLDLIFVDFLPLDGATYGTPTVTPTGVTGAIDCEFDFGVLVCFADGGLVTIPAGATIQIDIPVTVTATSGQLDNPDPNSQGACIVDPFGISGDQDPTNNFCSDSVGIGQPANPPAPTIFDPALSKSGSPASARVGETVTWTLVVSNPHAVALPGIVVTDTIPAQFSINNVTTQQGTASTSGQVITVNVGVLAPGQSVTITIVTTAISSPTNGTICNTAQSGGSFAQTCMQVFPSTLPPTGGASPLMVTLRNSLFALIAVMSIAAAGLFVLKRRQLA